MRTRRILALVMSLAMAIVVLPFGSAVLAEKPVEDRLVGNGGLVLDTDPTGGYEGDYVVIYNPATSSSTSYSTGTMTGLIETSVGSKAAPAANDSEDLYIIDVDGEIAARERAENPDYGKIDEEGGVRASYQVGSTRSFSILAYSPGGSSITFKVLAVGQHCYIWTPSTNNANYYTLDSINPDYAQQAADEFDRMYDLMNVSFGSHSNGSNGDGKVSLLFYNIDDGFDPNSSSGYVAGYFSSSSYMYDGLPIINIDTYPGVYYVTPSGVDRTSMSRSYGVACHEYQHCINYSNTSSMSTWLNECFSAAAEEICYPGSSVVSRIQSWENYFYSSNGDWQTPPEEFQYQSSFNLHNGYSMYSWSNDLDDVLALYAQVSLFAQYLYTQCGNTIYKAISNAFKSSSSEPSAITTATGTSCTEFVKNYRIAVYANDHEAYEGQYGFVPQTGYDPAEYNNVENPYNLLGPVVFTGTSCSIKGGGAICVKPVNGVYNPPSGANSNLVYIGITRNLSSEPVDLEGITLSPASVEIMAGQTANLSLAKIPSNANGYEVEWTSSRPAVATVSGSKSSATVTGVAAGTAVITATATDVNTGAVYTASSTVTVTAFEGFMLVSELEVGGRYIIASGNKAVGNTIYSNNHYLTAHSITVNSDNTVTVPASLDVNTILWEIESGTASAGYTFLNMGNNKYMGLDSGQYLYPSDTPIAWLYTGGDLNNQVDTDGYYYLTLSSNSNYFTTSKNTNGTIKFYKYIVSEPAEPDTYTVTFLDWDGTVLSVQEIEAGGAATAPADPVRPGYTFIGWDKSYTDITEDTVITAQYVANSYTLTVYYQYANGNTAANTYVGTYTYGAEYNVASPAIVGYTPDIDVVTGAMPAANVEVTVTYTANVYQLIIHYVFEDGTEAAPDYVGAVAYGANYEVPTPAIEGYTADIELVEGVMGAEAVEVTVTYTAIPTPVGLLGDVDCDGEVTFSDISLLAQYLNGQAQITPQGLLNADMDQNGEATFADVGSIYQFLVG